MEATAHARSASSLERASGVKRWRRAPARTSKAIAAYQVDSLAHTIEPLPYDGAAATMGPVAMPYGVPLCNASVLRCWPSWT